MVITFVCMGNICRSPMAECLFKALLKQKKPNKTFVIQSAGTHGINNGQDMDFRVKTVLQKHNIPLISFKSKQINQAIFNQSDLILAMDNKNIANLYQMFGINPKINKITQYCSNPTINEITDPWYDGKFKQVFELLVDCLNNLYHHLNII